MEAVVPEGTSYIRIQFCNSTGAVLQTLNLSLNESSGPTSVAEGEVLTRPIEDLGSVNYDFIGELCFILQYANIVTLGDLVKLSRIEVANIFDRHRDKLNYYHNYTSTSLVWIIEIALWQYHLRLRGVTPSKYELAHNHNSIRSLNMSARAYNVLQKYGIDTIGCLIMHSEKQLMQLKGCGGSIIHEIEETLQEYDLQLRGVNTYI